MKHSKLPTGAIRSAGAIIGLAAALALVAAARPSSSMPGLPASIRFTVAPPGTLAVTPAPPAPVLDAKHLVPGGRRLTADLGVQNQSGITLQVGIHATAAVHNLDGLLRIRIASGGRVLADTTLQALRRGIALGKLTSGAMRQIHIAAWIPGAITDGYQGIVVEGSFGFTARPIGAGA
jgi:hypothetical protein